MISVAIYSSDVVSTGVCTLCPSVSFSVLVLNPLVLNSLLEGLEIVNNIAVFPTIGYVGFNLIG